MTGEPFGERSPSDVWWTPGIQGGTAQAAVLEFGAWMGKVPWESWGTFTYAPRSPVTGERVEPTIDSARRSIEWFLDLGLVQSAVWVTERGAKFGRVHNHALLSGFAPEPDSATLDRVQLVRMWETRHGFARLEAFDPKRGAAGYVGKYLRKQDCDWDLWQASRNSPTLPRGSRSNSSMTNGSTLLWQSATRLPQSQSARSSRARRRASQADIAIPPTSALYFDGTRRVTPGSSTNPPDSPGISRTLIRDSLGR